MRSSLKKSLYLGLAALSFASVAGAAFENTTASAKKTTKKAKKTTKKAAKKAYPKVTSLVNISNQDSQPVGYTISGNLTNKPAGVKGAHDVATGISNSTIFMRYQTATLSNGKTYYKVVSFDHKYRGFVSADQIQNTSTYTNIDLGNNQAVYLAHPGTTSALYSSPQGATFKDQVSVPASQTGKFANSQFGISAKATVKSTGETVLHLVDLANTSVQGWVKASDVTSSANRYFDQSADVKVNFVDSQSGNTVASQIVNITNNPNASFTNSVSNDRILDPTFFAGLFNVNSNGAFTIQDAGQPNDLTSNLASAGYAVTSADLAYSKQNFGTVKVGDTVNVKVTSIANNDQKTSQLRFKSISPVVSGSTSHPLVQWNPADAKDLGNFSQPALNSTQASIYQSEFTGNKNTFVGSKNGKGLDSIFNVNDPIFGSNGFLSFLQGTDNTSITSTSQYTNGYVSNSTSKSNNNNDGQVTNAYNNQTSGMLAFPSDAAAQAAGAKTSDTYSLAQLVADNQSSLTPLKIGQQFHFAYVVDRQATMQYNKWATLYGGDVTVVYDAVPVATPVSSTTTSTGFTNYLAK